MGAFMARAVTIESLSADRLDVTDLNKRGLLGPDWVTAPLRWPGVAELLCARYAVQLRLYGHDRRQRIAIAWVFGISATCGQPYFRCPHCQRRVRHLYRALGGHTCRRCIGPTIRAAQTLDRRTRPHREACRIRLILNAEAKIGAPIPPRPKGMRRARYARLVDRLIKAEGRLSPRMCKKPPPYSTLLNYVR
jgi:hypothetical protein